MTPKLGRICFGPRTGNIVAKVAPRTEPYLEINEQLEHAKLWKENIRIAPIIDLLMSMCFDYTEHVSSNDIGCNMLEGPIVPFFRQPTNNLISCPKVGKCI